MRTGLGISPAESQLRQVRTDLSHIAAASAAVNRSGFTSFAGASLHDVSMAFIVAYHVASRLVSVDAAVQPRFFKELPQSIDPAFHGVPAASELIGDRLDRLAGRQHFAQ